MQMTIRAHREVDLADEESEKGEAVYHRLKEVVVTYQVPPHKHLKMRTIADKMQVSTTPVREAFIRLADERLISLAPGQGFYSNALDIDDLQDIYDVWLIFARHALRSAIKNFDTAHPDVPDGFGLIAEGAIGVLKQFSEDLYLTIAGLPGNRELLLLTRNFIDRTTFIRDLDLRNRRRFRAVARDLARLVTCLKAADAEGAVTALEILLSRKRRGLRDLVKEGNARAVAAGCQIKPVRFAQRAFEAEMLTTGGGGKKDERA